jgi:hypothetical protein
LLLPTPTSTTDGTTVTGWAFGVPAGATVDVTAADLEYSDGDLDDGDNDCDDEEATIGSTRTLKHVATSSLA